MSASISSWWWWLKLACVSIFWPFWPNNSFVTGDEKCCYFEAEICEGEVICLLPIIDILSSAVPRCLCKFSDFRQITDFFHFHYSQATFSLDLSAYNHTEKLNLTFLDSWSIYEGTICQYGPLMGLFTSLQMFHWPISGYMDYCLNSLRCFIGSQTSQHLYV